MTRKRPLLRRNKGLASELQTHAILQGTSTKRDDASHAQRIETRPRRLVDRPRAVYRARVPDYPRCWPAYRQPAAGALRHGARQPAAPGVQSLQSRTDPVGPEYRRTWQG